MKDLLYLQEHRSCWNYFSEVPVGFKYYETEEGELFTALNMNYQHLFFILKGEATISCNEFQNRYFKQGECILIPTSAEMSFKALTPTEIVIFTFESVNSSCDKLSLQSLAPISKGLDYDFEPTPIRCPLTEYLGILIYYLKNGMNCIHLHELKSQELFLVFRGYYSKEELANLFYPLIGRTIDFKRLIMENYRKVENVNELANLSCMSRANFDAKFKEEFGMPPYQWLLKQKAKHVRYGLSEPNATLSDIMRRYHFNSPTHFNRFCKQQFGCSPSELIKKIREEEA